VTQLAATIFANAVYPNPDFGRVWAGREGLDIVESRSYDGASAVIAALMTVSAILKLRAERGSRSIEESVYEKATTKMSEGLLALYQVVNAAADEPVVEDLAHVSGISAGGQATIPGLALSVLLEWAQGVAREEAASTSTTTTGSTPGNFAASMTRAVRGQEPSLAGRVTTVHVLLLLHDVDSELARNYLEAE
jgi:hypothetical protein